MIASLSPNSLKQYNVYLRKWFVYCTQNDIDFYNASIPNVITFLMQLFNEGAQYGSLNTCRSAISLIIGDHIGQNDSVKRFFKGIFRLRPPLPRYNRTWDTSIVLNYLENLYPNDNLSLEMITKKLVTLLALVTAHRVQTLSKISIDNISISSTRININITELIKTSRPGSSQPILILPFYNQKPELCPGKTLQSYLAKTNDLRKNVKNLFIGLKKPHSAVSAQTLSRWIRSTLGASGVDVAAFGAHSTRHAATSAQHRAGVSLDHIRRTAGWSGTSNVFFKFYNKPLQDDVNNDYFARAIIDSSLQA